MMKRIEVYAAVPTVGSVGGGIYRGVSIDDSPEIKMKNVSGLESKILGGKRTPLDLACCLAVGDHYWATNTKNGFYICEINDGPVNNKPWSYALNELQRVSEIVGGQICYFEYTDERGRREGGIFCATYYYSGRGDAMNSLGVLRGELPPLEADPKKRRLVVDQRLQYLKPNGLIQSNGKVLAISGRDKLWHWNGTKLASAKDMNGLAVTIDKPEYKHQGEVNNEIVCLGLGKKYSVIGTSHGRFHLFREQGMLEYILQYSSPSLWDKEGFEQALPTIPDSLALIERGNETYLLVGMERGRIYVYDVHDDEKRVVVSRIRKFIINDDDKSGEPTIKKLKVLEVDNLQRKVFLSFKRKIWGIDFDQFLSCDHFEEVQEAETTQKYLLDHRAYGFDVIQREV